MMPWKLRGRPLPLIVLLLLLLLLLDSSSPSTSGSALRKQRFVELCMNPHHRVPPRMASLAFSFLCVVLLRFVFWMDDTHIIPFIHGTNKHPTLTPASSYSAALLFYWKPLSQTPLSFSGKSFTRLALHLGVGTQFSHLSIIP